MSNEYADLPVDTDPNSLAQGAFDYLEIQSPGWTPSDGQLDVWILVANARMAAMVRDLAASVPPSIFRYLGKNLFSVPAIDQQGMVLTMNFTPVDNGAYVAPAGTNFALTLSGDVYLFESIAAFGTTGGAAGTVQLQAVNSGAELNSLVTIGAKFDNTDSLQWLNANSLTVASIQTPGVDAEDDDTYQDRLTQQLRLISPRPILPNDFAQISKNRPDVYRALALDGYDPTTFSYGIPRSVTVIAINSIGQPSDATALQNYLRSLRELSFQVYAIAPTYTTIDIMYSVKLWPNYTLAQAQAEINDRLHLLLDPLTFGMPTGGDTSLWVDQSSVKINDIIAAIGSAPSVNDVISATIRKGANAFAAADVPISGPGALTQLGVVTPTILLG